MSLDILEEIGGRAPRQLLEELAAIGRALAKVERHRPEVELVLSSGALIRGRIVNVVEDRGTVIVTIHVGGPLGSPSVAFVRLDQIAAVTLADATQLVRGPRASNEGPPTSRLELQRQLAAHSETIAAAIGHAMPITVGELDDDGRRVVRILLPILAEVLIAIASTDLGKAALGELTRIELDAAPRSETARTGSTLVIKGSAVLTDAYTKASLRAAIEKVV